jgi:hypothetical protein
MWGEFDVHPLYDDPMLAEVHPIELLVAAAIGAVLGIVTGYALGHEWLGILIWALIGAVVVSGAVYCYRFFR